MTSDDRAAAPEDVPAGGAGADTGAVNAARVDPADRAEIPNVSSQNDAPGVGTQGGADSAPSGVPTDDVTPMRIKAGQSPRRESQARVSLTSTTRKGGNRAEPSKTSSPVWTLSWRGPAGSFAPPTCPTHDATVYRGIVFSRRLGCRSLR